MGRGDVLKRASFRRASLISCGALLLATAALSAPVTVTYEYDSASRLISATQVGDTQITYVYDAAGNRLMLTVEPVPEPTSGVLGLVAVLTLAVLAGRAR